MVFKLNTTVTSAYRHLAIIFFIMATFLTVIREVFRDIFGDEYFKFLGPIVMPIGILFFVFMVRVIKNLGVQKVYVRFVLAFLVIGILLRIFIILFTTDIQIRFILGALSSGLLLAMQSVCVYFMSVNLFMDVNTIKEKLWASVCVYFMIGSTFGTLYSLLISFHPEALGIALTNPADIYIMGLVYSFNVISGLDPIYDHASQTIRMTSVLESIFIMLFMVILIGRLLGSKD